MKLRQTLTIALLGSATLIPALPSWADPTATAPQATAPSAANSSPPNSSAPNSSPTNSSPTDSSSHPGTATEASESDMRQRRQADRKAFLDARIAALHAGLQLTPDQQALWSPVEGALRDLGALRGWRGRGMHDRSMHDRDMRDHADDAGDPVARLKRRSAHLIARGEAMAKLADASGPLVKALTTAQRDRLPALLEGMHPRRIIAQAFALADDREGREGGGWHRRDRQADGDEGFRGWHHHHDEMRGDERSGDGDRDTFQSDEDGGPRRHRHQRDEDRDDDGREEGMRS